MACELGINLADSMVQPSCSSGEPQLKVDWSLHEDNRLVSQYGSSDPTYGAFLGGPHLYGGAFLGDHHFLRILGRFRGLAGHNYRLDIETEGPPSLMRYRARLSVTIAPQWTEAMSVGYLIVAVVSILALATGSSILIVGRRRRSDVSL